ncbi:hypothetical protein [Thalassotalea mangrovi]|uniref:Thiamin/hydroxymethyl pyrimidine-binding YkoF putative domain-containing protein n=1 Tax=Thalassotalea mangrovi TaxID=2572245 RepID=A0A4U1B6W9_9GAMM|nr:hypothetical protein [Thalassotalea mangrovi]TKB46314.1 hypothetical protein E8M12_04475 [Thalassotalea mangrovi]
MQVSIEISLYPLAEQTYKSQIWGFIDNLKAIDGLAVVTNGMSTQVFGDYDLATSTVMAEIKKVHQALGAAVFVCKFIAGDRQRVEARN